MSLAARQPPEPELTPPEPGDAIPVAEGVLWARLPLPMAALNHVNVYALDDGPDGWTLVDTGIDWGAGRAALAALRTGPLGGRPIHRVVLTHHHPDHIGQAGPLALEGAEIVTTRIAWLTGRMLQLDVQDHPTHGQIAFRRDAGVDADRLEAYAKERPFNFADCVASIPLGYRAVDEGDWIEAAGRRWQVRLGEGHAPAHLTLWSEDGALLLSGDQVLPGISPNIGVYPTEPEADPLAGWLETCRRFAALGADPLVLPGHKRPFRGLAQRLAQLIENHDHALERIEAALRTEPLSAVGLFPALYRRPIGDGEYGLAMAEAIAHANHLYCAGRVTRHRGTDGAWLYQPMEAA
ncbi:MAG: MBL fold metallo-hydrolase [Pseudomonadota bacterium]